MPNMKSHLAYEDFISLFTLLAKYILIQDWFSSELLQNIAKGEQSSHTPGGSHQRPYHFNWKERNMDN